MIREDVETLGESLDDIANSDITSSSHLGRRVAGEDEMSGAQVTEHSPLEAVGFTVC